jgi:hypothetical protein
VSPKIVRYTTCKELLGKRPTETEFLEEIRSLNAPHTVWFLARLNLLLELDRFHSDENGTAEVQEFLANLLMDEDLFSHFREKFGAEPLDRFRLFHSLQILTLIKRVAMDGSKEGGLRPDADKHAAWRLGRCLLMANDFLSTPENASELSPDRPSIRRKIALQLQLGAGMEVNNPPSIGTSLVRSDIIFGDLLRIVETQLDLRTVFLRNTGMAIEDYVDHVLGLLAYYTPLDFRRLIEDPGPSCVGVKTFFANSPQDIVEKFWRSELVTTEGLETALREPSQLKPHHDFIVFRKRPVLEVAPNTAVAVHLGFLQEKLESGLFWAIFNSLGTQEEHSLLFSDWGRLFEQYVSQLLAQSLRESSGSFVAFPKFSDNGDEAFDGVVSAGKYWVVMEYKGGFLSANAKYADNSKEFLWDLDRKFGAGKRAGAEQLMRKIAAVFAEKPSERRSLKGLDTTAVECVVPVLIVQESFVSSQLTTPYLVDVFQSLKYKQRLDSKVTYTFPLILDLSEIEALKPFLATEKISLVDCLMARVRIGSSVSLSFGEFFRQYLHDRKIGPVADEETQARVRKIMDRVCERFFGRPFAPE